MASRRCFVSHAGADAAWAEWIATELRASGDQVTLATWDWRAGENFVSRMNQALDDAEVLVAVLSRSYFDSRYAEMEWTAAITDTAIDVVPVRIDDVEPPRLLAPILYADLHGLAEDEARTALQAAIARAGPRGAFPGTTVDARPPSPLPPPPSSNGGPPSLRPELCNRLRTTLRSSERPVVVSGPPYSGAESLARAAVVAAFGSGREVVVVRLDDAETSARSLLLALASQISGGEPRPDGFDDVGRSGGPAGLGDVAGLLGSDTVLLVLDAHRLHQDELDALVAGFGGRALVLHAREPVPTSPRVEAFAVPPMQPDEARQYLRAVSADRYGVAVDVGILDDLAPEIWSLPEVIDALLPDLLDATPSVASWLSDLAEVHGVSEALGHHVASMDPADLALLSAVVLAPPLDLRRAVEDATQRSVGIERLLAAVRRGLLVREADGYVVPAALRDKVPTEHLQTAFDALTAADCRDISSLGAVERLAHVVAVGCHDFGLALDTAVVGTDDVLDGLNSHGKWGSYLVVLDRLVETAEVSDPRYRELQLRRCRKRLQLGDADGAARILDALAAAGDDAGGQTDITSHRALLLFGSGRLHDALDVGARAVELAEDAGDARRLARAANLVGEILLSIGAPQLAVELFDSAIAAAATCGDGAAELDAEVGRLQAVAAGGDEVDWGRAAERLTGRIEDRGHRTQLGRLHYLAAVQAEPGHPVAARRHAELACRLSDPGSSTFSLAARVLDRLPTPDSHEAPS